MHRYKTAWYSIRPPVSTRDFQAVKLEAPRGAWGERSEPGGCGATGATGTTGATGATGAGAKGRKLVSRSHPLPLPVGEGLVRFL